MAFETRDEDAGVGIGLKIRRALVKSTGVAVAFVVCLVLATLVGGHGAVDRLLGALGITQGQDTHLGSYALIAIALFIFLVRLGSNGLNVWSAESDVDSFHRRYNYSSMINLMLAGAWISNLGMGYTPGEAPPLDHLIFAAVFLLVLTGEIVFGPVSFHPAAREAFKDEFYGAMRAKANKAGLDVVMLAGCAAIFVLLLNRYQGPAAALLCGVVYAGAAGP
jgi:hypothetical protein